MKAAHGASRAASMATALCAHSAVASPLQSSLRGRVRPSHVRAAPGDGEDAPSTSYQNSLETTIKRKSVQVEAALKELGLEALEERLSSATQTPASPAYRFSRLVSELTERQGRAAIVVEVTRPSPSATAAQLGQAAKAAIACGADALCVRLDSEDTPSGVQDLFTVVQAAGRTPVLARDWIIHPLQLVEAKEAGAAGVLGVIAQVCVCVCVFFWGGECGNVCVSV